MTYKEFLERKIDIAPLSGIEIDPSEVSPALKIPADLLSDPVDKPDLSEVPTDTLLEQIRRRTMSRE